MSHHHHHYHTVWLYFGIETSARRSGECDRDQLMGWCLLVVGTALAGKSTVSLFPKVLVMLFVELVFTLISCFWTYFRHKA